MTKAQVMWLHSHPNYELLCTPLAPFEVHAYAIAVDPAGKEWPLNDNPPEDGDMCVGIRCFNGSFWVEWPSEALH